MAEDKTQQKTKNVQAEQKKGREDVRTKIQNAQRFSELLALEDLTPEEKVALEYAQNFEEFSRILGQRHIEEQRQLWEAREDWWTYRNVPSPAEPPVIGEAGNKSQGLSPGVTGSALVGLGLGLTTRPEKYEDFKKRAVSYAENAAKLWEEEEKKNQKKPPKTIDPNKPASRQEAYDRASSDYHDMFVRGNLKRANKWAAEQNDPVLNAAIERKRLQDESEAIKNQGRISKALDRNPAAKFAPPVTSQTLAQTPIPANTFPGTLPPNTLQGVGQPNVLRGSQPTNVFSGDQAPATSPKTSGFRNRLKSYGPRAMAKRAKARFMGSRLGKRLASSRMGRLAGKANRLGGIASKATRRIKNMLSPIAYLQRLFMRSLIGSLIGAVGGLASAALAALAGLTVTVAGSAAAIITGLTSAVAGISLGAALAVFTVIGIIILLIITLFALLFQPPSKGELPSQSPYPGIFYSIVGEEKVPNGQNIKYDIIFGYDSTQATAATPPLENITLAADIPLGTVLVAGQTTGNYTLDSGKIGWKLSGNETETDVVTQKSYHFVLTLDPDDDITVTVTIGLEGAGKGGGGPGDESGDLYAGADSSPTDNTCSKYGGVMGDIQGDFPQMSIATNFGDPECSYTDAKFKKVLELTETNTKNIEFWQDITDCESGSANGYSPAADGGGTWGRFQMRRGFPNPGKPWKAEDNDRGDVPWQRQIQNATSYNNSLAASGNNFGYWGTAMCLCYYSKYNNQPYCGDIKNNNKVRSPSSELCSSCTVNKGRR